MSITITFTNPEENYNGGGGCSAAVPVATLEPVYELGVVSSCTLTIAHDVSSKYGLETDDANNPCQVNSTALVAVDGSTVLRGRVADKPKHVRVVNDQRNTVTYLSVKLEGNEAALLDAVCPDASGNESWTMATDTYQVGAAGAMPLKASSSYGTFASDTLWPDPADAEGAKCYISDAKSPSDTINAQILIGAACPFYIEFTATDQGFPPQFWLKINAEWFYCEGYDATGGGGRYRTQAIARAELGTAAAGHAANDTAYAKVAKKIGPQTPVLYRDDGGGAVKMRYDKDYKVLTGYGCFVLVGLDAGADTFTGTYSVYDEDKSLDAGSNVVYLEDVVQVLVTGPAAYGGAGFAAGDCDFDALEIGITRIDYDPEKWPQTPWNAIQHLIRLLKLEDEIGFWFKHSTGKFRLAQIGNAGAPDLTITGGIQQVQADMSLRDVYSAVRVAYTYDQDPNLIKQEHSYHCEPAAAGAQPDRWLKVTAGGEDWHTDEYVEYATGDPADTDFGVDMLTDGKNETKLMADYEHDPGGEFDFCHFWFGDGAPTIRLDYLDLWVNAYRAITSDRSTRNDEGEFVVRVDGCADYDTATHAPTSGVWYELGGAIMGVPSRDGTAVELEMSSFIVRQVNAIRIVFEYMAGPVDGGDQYWACVHQLIVQGNVTKYALVQTTDNAALKTEPEYIYNVGAHTKLRGGINSSGSAGCPRVKSIKNIGPASDAAALTIGRAYLRNALKLYSMRQYRGSGALSAWPELGDTIAIDEDSSGAADYTGVCRMFKPTIRPGKRTYQLRVLDYDASDIE